MKYQLVLQWPALSIDDYDSMMLIEDSLIERLPDDCEVDGHDAGSGEVNIFILTNEPEKTFNDVQKILKDEEAWSDIRVAYRDVDRNDYTILWPTNLNDFRVA